MVAVVFTFFDAQPACLGAGLERDAGHRGVVVRLAAEDPAGGVADVGAVEVTGDAASERVHGGFGEAGVGAGNACLGALETSVDTRCERFRCEADLAGGGVEHGT